MIDIFFLIHDKLQVVSEELVHLADAGRDAEVNGSVADLDDESTNDVGVDLERLREFDMQDENGGIVHWLMERRG